MKIVNSTMSSQPFELIEYTYDPNSEKLPFFPDQDEEVTKYSKYIQELLLDNCPVIKHELEIPSGSVFGSVTIPEPGMFITIEEHLRCETPDKIKYPSEFLYTVCGETVNRYTLKGRNIFFDLGGILLVQDNKACLYWLDLARNDLFPVAGPQIDGPSAVDSSTNPPTIITLTSEKILRRKVKNIEDELVFEIVNEMPNAIGKNMEEVLVCERGLIFASHKSKLYIISPDFLSCSLIEGWRVCSNGKHKVKLVTGYLCRFKVHYKYPDS